MNLAKLNKYVEKLLFSGAILCFLWGFIEGGIMNLKTPISMLATLAALHILLKYSQIEISEGLRTSFYAFILVALFLADEFHFYSIIPYLDKLEHLMSGVILCQVGCAIFKHINRKEIDFHYNKQTLVLFGLFFAIAMAGCWEIFEFSSDHILGTMAQKNSLWDTMTDIICGTTGASATAVFLYRVPHSRRVSQTMDNQNPMNF